MPVFLGEFNNADDVCQQFHEPMSTLDGCEIIVASYDTPAYEGYAYVLFEKNGKLWEVHGSHCSCMGLEDQWDPQETTIDALRHQLEQGHGWRDSNVDGVVRHLIDSRGLRYG